jgi:glycine oxidase
VGYRRTGLLRCALDADEETRLRDFLWQRERGLPTEWVEPGALAERSGAGLSAEARAGVFFPDEGVVDPRRLMSALAASAAARGVEIRTRTAARRFLVERDRCLGIETDGGTLEAGCVVDAAGAWAGFDRGLPFVVSVEPVRGQIVELALGPETPRAVLHGEAVYLAPHADGRVLVGSTLERVGFRKEVTAGGVQKLLDAAARLLPAARQARFVTAWAGLRPGTPDSLPVLGGCRIDRLFFASGHFRNGILLAPVTAALLADRIMGGAPAGLEPFSVERFASSGTGVRTKARTPGISDRIEKITRGETR